MPLPSSASPGPCSARIGPPPKVVILENVDGITNGCSADDEGNSNNNGSPMHFVLHGIRMEGKKNPKTVKYGLMLNDRYYTEVHTLQSNFFQLPHERKRIYIIMVRKDVADAKAMVRIKNFIDQQRMGALPRGHVQNFFLDPKDAKELEDQGWGGRTAGHMKGSTLKGFNAHRLALNFPDRDAPGGRPYSSSLPQEVQKRIGPRKCEMLDLIHLEEVRVHGSVREDLIVDLSQSMERRTFHANGSVPTPTTSSEYWSFSEKRFLTCPEVFALQGWDPQMLSLYLMNPKDGDWRKWTGNMMSLPCIGCCLAAVLANIYFGVGKDWRCKAAVDEDEVTLSLPTEDEASEYEFVESQLMF
eukprot:15456230-Alexandrium_andersonii.AAC.1